MADILKGYPDILTVQEVAKILRVHVTTVYNLTREGDLPSIKVGKSIRIYKSDLSEYMNP